VPASEIGHAHGHPDQKFMGMRGDGVSDDSIIIVGAGQAGGCAAAALRDAGYTGHITLIGNEVHLPYERPPLSKGVLSGDVALDTVFLRTPDWYESSRIELRLGTGIAEIDRDEKRVVAEDGRTFRYDKLLMTTGARARKLALSGSADSEIIYLRGIDDTFNLRDRLKPGRKIAIVGAGFIGLEIAATAITLGCDVEVFEVAPGPLGRVMPDEIGNIVFRKHADRGVRFRFRAAVIAVDHHGSKLLLHLANGEAVEADTVIAGIGAVPNDELASRAGIAVSNGIVVDEFGRTSDPSIFAAGDVTRHYNPLLKRQIRLEAWQNAQNQAIAVANVMVGGTAPFAEVPWLWSDQFDMNLQIAGHPIEWDELVWRGEPEENQSLVFQLLDGVPVGAIAINSARDMRFARQLIAKGQEVKAELLADKTYKLQELCR
jgi:3-phenylpropionate/trans-cinnamate dioxygenase ferredoxin reductase component